MARNSNKDSFSYEQEKREFIDGLRHFHINRCTPFERVPRLGKEEVDLYLLYQKVTSLGGWKKVTENQRWEEIVDEFKFPKACLNAELALKLIYVRYLNVYEQINFLGEDPKNTDVRRDDEGPHRKKLCVPQFNMPMAYNSAQHDIAENLRSGYGLATTYARLSDYDKLEKALQSGMPNEVDFVINVCTLLSNESKHTLRLDKSIILTDLLLAHIGIFQEGCASMEKLYENGWREHSSRDFIKFWYDTVHDEPTRKLISHSRADNRRDMVGSGVLHLGRNQGVQDKEGIRITQVAIIIRNLSFDQGNMRFLANNDLVFRFLLLCIHCNYGTLRQLALDTMGNLAEQFVLDPVQSFKSQTILSLLGQCITSTDKFAVVRGLEMVAKLSRLEDNEYVLSEKLDTAIYEEIAKYLTIHDIQLIVSSLEALYQLSEIGEETNAKIAEVSNTVDTLVSLITVEAQSYGPNSLVGIKVVEYCPPPHLTGGVPDGTHGGVGPPAQQPPPSQQQGQPAQSQPPGNQPTSSLEKKSQSNTSADNTSPMETTTCNWLQASYEVNPKGGVVSHVSLYTDYLQFCKKFQLNQALPSQIFSKMIKVVFPKVRTVINITREGRKELCVHGINKRSHQLPFSISCPVSRTRSSVVPSTSSVRPNSAIQQSPTLLQRLAAPPSRPVAPNHPIYPAGVPAQHVGTSIQEKVASQPLRSVTSSTAVTTMPTYSVSGGIAAQGYVTDTPPPPPVTTASSTQAKPKVPPKKKSSKKNTPILPRPEQNTGNLPNIVPKIAQQPVMQNVQYTTYPQEIVYQTVDPQNAEAKVMVKTLLAQKIRQGNVIIQQPLQGVVSVDPSCTDGQQTLQYQTSYQQTVPQTTYIQYAVSSANTQAVQTFIHQNQSSQVQTFVMPSGEVYVQNQLPASSLGTQIVAQQPVVVAQHQNVIPQQQIAPQQLLAQAPAGLPQPQVIPQTQVISAPQVVAQNQTLQDQQLITQQIISQSLAQPTQIITQPQTIAQSQIISQPQMIVQQQVANPQINAVTASEVSSSVSSDSFVASTASFPSSSVSQTSVENTLDTNTNCSVESSASQDTVDTSGLISSSGDKQIEDSSIQETETSVQCSVNECNGTAILENKNISDETESVSANESDKPSIDMNTGISKMGLSSNEAEIESAVGSIMDDNDGDSQEEPVMIENDGNELMFEQKYQPAASDAQMTEVYMEDEAAAAVGQLEQMEQTSAENDLDTEQVSVLTIDEGNTSAMNDGNQMDQVESEATENDVEQDQIGNRGALGDQTKNESTQGIEAENNNMDSVEMQTGQVLTDDMCNDQDLINDDLADEKVNSDKEIIERFRAETPIIVPIVSENGLYEQDFEARMAVENLLKDVEFTVNGDDSCSEENVNVYSCQQQNPGSVQTESSLGESEIPVCEDSRDSVCSESQTNTKTTVVNQNGTCVTAKSLPNATHVPHNGINSEGKPLLNGNISSPEYQSVPSPGVVNGGDPTKLVNGIGDEKSIVTKTIDKITKLNGVVNHKLEKVLDVANNALSDIKMEVESSEVDLKVANPQDILAQSIMDSQIDKGSDDKNGGDILAQSIIDSKMVDTDKKMEDNKADTQNDGDILARSILENDIQPSDCDIPDPEPTSVTAVVKQIIPNTVYGNIMTVQINNNTIPITFTTNAIITSKNSLPNQINVCNSRHIPTPESSARDGELSCDSSTSSITTSDLNIVISDKHSSVVSQSKMSHKDSIKSVTSPKSGESKKSKSKKRSRSKSGGSGTTESSRPSSATSPAAAAPPPPEFMCEWTACRRCFANAKSVFNHICAVHLKTEYDGLCKWDGCETLVRKRWSLFTHVQDHHCSETSLRVAAQRRLQSLQTGQTIQAPSIPAMVYPNDAATQAIKRFQPKPPYPEFQEGREGPVTKHIRLTSALILRNLAKYSPSGRSLLKKHERVISFVCMSAVESSTALASCLYEILQDQQTA